MVPDRNGIAFGVFGRVAIVLPLALLAVNCGGSDHNTMNAPPPSVTISVSPSTVNTGEAATLTWSSTLAASCTASGSWSGTEATSGTQTVTPTTTGSATYTLTCAAPSGSGYTGGGGATTSQSTTLTVNAASTFTVKNLVGDTAASAPATVDPNLVNPWGIVFGPGPVWVSNNHSSTSTLYDGNGVIQPLVVQLPAGTGGDTFDPTGIVFNSSSDFVVSSGGHSGAALFIYSGEGGSIAGWSNAVDLQHAITVYTDTGGAVYKGLAIANNGTANFLYATDFHNGKIDVFDATYTKQAAANFPFADSSVPAGYAPFGIQAIANGPQGTMQIYVTFAMQQGPDNVDNANGAGLGIVDVFDTSGALIKQLVAPGGALNAPWGLALAPSDFGTFSNALLVGDFGDGKIYGYDPSTGRFLGALTDSTGTPLSTPGLWGIAFGNDVQQQPHNTLYFAAGPNDEANGLYGRIDLAH
ncbi:MAG TPA: TIGR03118 family protein [Steroidobacteraceae bacterium]|nr:TIGR03118 family protein [Steroidobacteraceae bacterium]